MKLIDGCCIAGASILIIYLLVLVYNLKLSAPQMVFTAEGLTSKPANRVFAPLIKTKERKEFYGQYKVGDIDGERYDFIPGVLLSRPGTQRPHLISLVEPGKNF